MSAITTARRPAHDANAAAVPVSGVPVHLTGFIGREREIDDVLRLLDDTRLLTLTGAGGSGKTRLAQETLRRQTHRSAREIAWIELASLEEPELVPQQVAAALGVREEGGQPPVEALVRVLRQRPLLLVLDNCEHVVDACAELADALLRQCAELRLLATSREPLGVAGERAWLVPPLSLPSADASSAADLGGSEAVQLFFERAKEVRPSFELTDANAGAVAEICLRLDGIPLAIELAATRVRTLSPEQIANRLDDAFRLLTLGGRTALPRHRTLRAAMDWSYQLLPDPAQRLLQRLSVFSGGFTLEVAEEICSSGGIVPEDVLDLLTHLVDRSLVVVRDREGALRYHLLETVRQYAAERLVESGDSDALHARHAAWFARLVAEAEPHLTTPRRREWVSRLLEEVDNLRHALDWTREHDPQRHLQLAGQMCWFWFSSRYWSEGRRVLEGALALPAAASATRERAALLFAAGVLATLQSAPTLATPWLEESAQIATALDDHRLRAYAYNYLGMSLIGQGLPEGRAPVEAALEWFRAAEEPYGARLALLLLSTLAVAVGDLEGATVLAEEGLEAARGFGQDRELAIALQCVADVALHRGQLERAAELYRESLSALQRDPFYVFIARGLEYLAVVHCDRGDAAAGARLFGAAAAVRDTLGAAAFKVDQARYALRMGSARSALGARAFDAAYSEGQAMAPGDALQLALAEPNGGAEVHPLPATGRGASPRAVPPRAEPELVVRALGPLEVLQRGSRLDAGVWGYAKPRELLVYLLCHPEGRTREQIGVVFWPDATPAQVKNNVHVMLYRLRKALGRSDSVLLRDDRYRIHPELDCFFDAADFEVRVVAALREARGGVRPVEHLDATVALYRGDFLEGESVGDWHLEHHDRLRRLYVDALARLGELLMEQERYDEAAHALERLLRKEDLREDAHRNLMLCRARFGARHDALRQFEQLSVLLEHELDAVPEPETRALYERLKRGESI